MKRAFIRALWGVTTEKWNGALEEEFKIPKDNLFVKSRNKTERIIKDRMQDKFTVPFVTYVMGKDNYDCLINMGLKDVVLVDERPVIYSPLNKRVWWHKLDILKYAMQEDGYDEIVYLDWDCFLVKELNSDFWEELGRKEHFQACLAQYQRGNIITERDKGNNTVPNGGFVYIRGKEVPEKIISFRDKGSNKYLDEAAYARYLDDICGGWIGVQEYASKFEPSVCRHKRGIIPKNEDEYCFFHKLQK